MILQTPHLQKLDAVKQTAAKNSSTKGLAPGPYKELNLVTTTALALFRVYLMYTQIAVLFDTMICRMNTRNP